VGSDLTSFIFQEFQCQTGVTISGDGLTYEVGTMVGDVFDSSVPDGLSIDPITPDSDRNLKVSPVDKNTLNSFEFNVRVTGGDQHIPEGIRGSYQSAEFGPYTLNLTCDNNVIVPQYLTDFAESGETTLELT
jgi:hypothetical protein